MSHQQSPNPNLTSELLAEHVGWMRALARRLVADEHAADDVVQDAMVRALERPPHEQGRLRGWLSTVVRNLSSEGHRSGDNRAAREAAGAREDVLPATDELVDRFQVGQRVAGLLMSLDEPYRTVLLHRFYEELPPREIAKRRGVPVATVKSQIQRGLAKLRERLDGDFGDRRSWLLAVLPLAQPPAAATLGAGAAVTTATAIKLLLAAGLIVSFGSWWMMRDVESEPAGLRESIELVAQAPRSSRPAPAAGSRPDRPKATEPPARRTAAAAPPAEAPTAPAPTVAPPKRVIEGRVVDAMSTPVPNTTVRVRRSEDSASTGWSGRFELATSRESGQIEIADDAWATVRAGSWIGDPRIEPVVVVAPGIWALGTVVDEWGRPLRGVELSLVLPETFESRLNEVLDASVREEWRAISGEGGVFLFDRIPAVADAELRVAHPRYEPVRLRAPMASTEDLVVTLTKPTIPEEHGLRGRVLLPSGDPAPLAWVSSGLATVRADEGGWFVIDLRRDAQPETLRAVLAGYQPAEVAREEVAAGRVGWPELVVLRLAGEALSISGRVVDAAGEPIEAARVWVGDPSPLGALGTQPLRIEALAAGAPVPSLAIDSIADLPKTDGNASFGSARPQLEPDGLLAWVETDSAGRFELGGLTDREYRLNVLGRDLSCGWIEDEVPAGARNVVLSPPAGSTLSSLRGRVVSQEGKPVEGVAITTWIPAVSTKQRVFGGWSDTTRFFLGKTTRSAADGSYDLGPVPARYLELHLVSDEILPAYGSVDDADDPENYEIRVETRAHLDVEIAPAEDAATAFRVRDVDGRGIVVYEMRADGYSNYDVFELDGGRSGVVTVPSHAAWLHLMDGETVVEEIPLRLVPGEITTIRR